MADDRLSPADARVVDPILTQAARGYRNPMAVYEDLFPVVGTATRGGRIIEFGAEDFTVTDIRRAPGANLPRFTIGWSDKRFALEQRALEYADPIEIEEEAAAVPGIDTQMVGSMKAKNIADLQIENEASVLAQTATNFGGTLALAGNARWDNDASSPSKAVQTAKAEVAGKIAMEPNTLVVGQEVHRALINNQDVIDRIKYVSESTPDAITAPLLARYFGVERYRVGRAYKGKPGAFTPLWGKVAVLVYVDVTPLAQMGSPSWSYTYRLNGYPVARPAYFDHRALSWCYPYITEDTPLVVGKDAGYLFTTAIT